MWMIDAHGIARVNDATGRTMSLSLGTELIATGCQLIGSACELLAGAGRNPAIKLWPLIKQRSCALLSTYNSLVV